MELYNDLRYFTPYIHRFKCNSFMNSSDNLQKGKILNGQIPTINVSKGEWRNHINHLKFEYVPSAYDKYRFILNVNPCVATRDVSNIPGSNGCNWKQRTVVFVAFVQVIAMPLLQRCHNSSAITLPLLVPVHTCPFCDKQNAFWMSIINPWFIFYGKKYTLFWKE